MKQAHWLILAQAETQGEAPAPAGDTAEQTQTTTKQQPPGEQQTPPARTKGLGDMWIPLILMFVVLWFFMFRGPKKRQKQQQKMLDAVKKNDRVRTIGGILGTVVEVREDELVIKIDETNNTKVHVTRNAIGKVLTETQQDKK